DAEVAAAAAHCPELVGVVNAVRRAQHAVRGDDVDLIEIVDGPAEPTRQVTEAAAQREAGDTDVRNKAEYRGEAVLLGGAVDIAEKSSRACMGAARIAVDVNVSHARHVEREP